MNDREPGFSVRTAWSLEESDLAAETRRRRRAQLETFDLTLSNPTASGFLYDIQKTLSPLSAAEAMLYDPDPRGLQSARESVSRYYADHSAAVDADALILTTSTSEAYSFLFRLLCDAGDEVLVAQPGYPLFEYLAALDDVQVLHYQLFYDFGWWIDLADLERRITPRTRAIVLVHPNNPTGHATSEQERLQLEGICRSYALTLIVDEVFLDYGLGPEPIRTFAHGPHRCLTFVVSGISKVAALPQMKVGWLAAFGPDDVRQSALRRLEVIADTFLSMNAPAQLALPYWLRDRHGIATQIRDRVRNNLCALRELRLDHFPVDAGWCAILRLPGQTGFSEEAALPMLRELGVITHPASFYGINRRSQVVISLLGDPHMFKKAVGKIKVWCESKSAT